MGEIGSAGGSTDGGEENIGVVSAEGVSGKRKDRDRGRGRHSGRRGSIEWGGLIERDITGYTNTTSNWVIATVPLMLKAIT